MSRTKKIIIAVAAAALLLAAALSIRFVQIASELDKAGDGNYNLVGPAETTARAESFEMFPTGEAVSSDDADGGQETTVREFTEEDFMVDEDFLNMPYEMYQAKRNKTEGLLGQIRRFDMDALTVTFDNVVFRPGLYVRDIVDTSYWYSLREDDIVPAGGSAYLCLKNDFWDDEEIKLVGTNDATNGNIVLWVHNYGSEPMVARDCVIYKYQISYIGCWEQFSEHPTLDYLGEYTFGSKQTPEADSVTGVTLDAGSCTRCEYGSVSGCQVLLDLTDDGLRAITVSYNEYYGPDFDSEGE